MLAATGELVLMCDADLSTPVAEVERLLEWLERGYAVVIGSRDMRESVLDPPQPRLRRWAAWGFRAIRRRLLLGELRDTQCGFKLFRREAAQQIFSRQTIDGWLFDCEVLGIAERLGYRIKEVGVVWGNNPDSRVKPVREALLAVPTLLAIRRRLGAMEERAAVSPRRAPRVPGAVNGMLESELDRAHRVSVRNRDTIRASASCGCFHCLGTFAPNAVRDWITEDDGGQTARCPLCGIDSVLGSASGFPLTREFLERMRRTYFSA
jgi:hypothetical protein